MEYPLLADFFELLNPSIFNTASLLLTLSFIIWELPRSTKLISEEYAHGVYPDTGRVLDFGLFFMGLLAMGYLFLFDATGRVAAFLRTPGITSVYLIIVVAVSILVLLGFLKRFFGRLDSHNSVTVFLVHGFLDFMHTIFFISLIIVVVPVAGFLINGHLGIL
jgi:hypothetical protein